MKLTSAKLFVVLTILSVAQAVDYCKLCSDHIACRHNGRFEVSCPADAKLVGLSAQNIQTVLNAHNKARNTVAGGGVPQLRSATKMMTLVSSEGFGCEEFRVYFQAFLRNGTASWLMSRSSM
jgi:hypothetical protein